MKWFFLLFGLCTHLCAQNFDEITPSTPEEIASLHADLLIEDYISVISGQLVISEVDLHVKGAQDLFFKRNYVAPQILGRYDEKIKEITFFLVKLLPSLKPKVGLHFLIFGQDITYALSIFR